MKINLHLIKLNNNNKMLYYKKIISKPYSLIISLHKVQL